MKNITKEQAGKNWRNWIWQQQNVVRDISQLEGYFPKIRSGFFEELKKTNDKLKFQITPYILSQLPKEATEEELKINPWFLQFFPSNKIYTEGHDAYNGTDNWEDKKEFPTRNIHHKYTNRALIRFRNCLAYCSFCFEALGVLEKNPDSEKIFKWEDWQKSLEYIAKNPDIEEVIFSGGEPLLLSDSKLEKILNEITDIKKTNGQPKIKFKRIHTRVTTHNPFRVTPELAELTAKYRVNEIALNIAHPSEITPEFIEAIGAIRDIGKRYAPMIVTHTPLLKGINDNAETLWELFGNLYENNIKPYYLLHTMPHTPYANVQRVSVRKGIELMKVLKRHKSNIAVPEYVIVHYDGKQTVPLEINGTPEFRYITKEGKPYIHFLNWKNKWVEYPDAEDTIK